MIIPSLGRSCYRVPPSRLSLSSSFRRLLSSSPISLYPPKALLKGQNVDISKIRNLGIFAHIDSGKTTLTESVLVHSGYIPHPGTVDLGTTSTDFLPAERERGITIQSASIPVQWAGHTINVVDTPGHIDFTMEVERAARVVDGAIVVMDGVEGVEGQTEGVWKQLTRYNVAPRILFINKLDRSGASLPHSLLSTTNRLHPLPLILTLPITSFDVANGKSGDPGIEGLVDIVSGRVWRWTGRRGEEVKEEGRIFDEFGDDGGKGGTFVWDVKEVVSKVVKKAGAAATPPPTPPEPFLPRDHPIRKEAIAARTALVETLSTHHLPLLEEFFDLPSPETEADIPSHLLVSPSSLRSAIRALTLSGQALPVLCGSAFKGIGVEVLLDAVRDYLPSPGDVGGALVVGGVVEEDLLAAAGSSKGGGAAKKGAKKGGWKGKAKKGGAVAMNEGEQEKTVEVDDSRVCALAFKVVWDDQKGWMTFVRVYSGTLTKVNLYNTSASQIERPNRIQLLYANNPIDVDSLPPGSIGVLLGLKHTRTGDTLLSGSDPRRLPPSPTRLRSVDLPNAVCSVAIHIGGKEEEKIVGEALERLVRQDPSLRLVWPEEDDSGQKVDPEAQTLLHGMGPLHLEISLRRLEDEQGVRARAGKMRVALKETVKEGTGMVELEEKWEGNVVGTQGPQQATVKIGLERLTDAELAEMTASGGGEHLAEWVNNDVSIEVGGASDPFFPLIPAISNALRSALTRGGPLLSYPLSHLRISITPLHADSSDEPSSPSLSSSSPDDIPAVLPPPAAIARAVASALKKAIKLSGPTILEPLVETRIWGVGPNDLGKVVADLISRGGQVQELGDEEMTSIGSTSTGGEGGEGGAYIPPAWVSPSASNTASSTERVQRRTILATMPLATMGDYAGKLRSLSGGGGVFESKEGGWGEVDLATVRKREERDGGE